ncbi:MAG: amidohydrolase family protein [Nannocystis sp.]|nr:amidohydrolase family protein [Nannocystis sp.]
MGARPRRPPAPRLAPTPGAESWARAPASPSAATSPSSSPSPPTASTPRSPAKTLLSAPEGGWLPDQRLDLDQALAAFTRGAAYAAFRDDHLGLLAPGYQADLTCFTADLHALSPTALRSAPVLATIIAGHPAYALA